MSNPVVDLLKKAVGLPVAKNGSCCSTAQVETAPTAAACCAPSGTAKTDAQSCCK